MIPIANIYLMLIFAWKVIEPKDLSDIPAFSGEQPVDLLAHLLCLVASKIRRSRLYQSYVPLSEEGASLRGRIDFAESFSSAAITRNRYVCESDALTADIPHNQILKACSSALLSRVDLDPQHRISLRELHQTLESVSNVPLSRRIFDNLELHRNNRDYAVALSICRLIYEELSPGEGGGAARMLSYERDEQKFRRLFEAFVRNFLKWKLKGVAQVGSARMGWWNATGADTAISLLPTLNMDVVVRSPDRTLIIDTKYTPRSTVEWRGLNRFRSEHLYQIYAYVENYAKFQSQLPVNGMLLYPAVGEPCLSEIVLDGRSFQVATVSLDHSWLDIQSRLVELSS